MTITAKYAGTCPACKSAIRPGEKVEWAKGSQARHVACATGVPTPVRTQPSRSTWGTRRGMGPGHGTAAPVRGYSSYCTDNEFCRCYDCAS